jgi:hypothetical protein
MRGARLTLESRLHVPSIESPELIAAIDCGGHEKLLVMLASERGTGAAIHLHRARVNAFGVVMDTPLHVAFSAEQLQPLRQALDRVDAILAGAVPLEEGA